MYPKPRSVYNTLLKITVLACVSFMAQAESTISPMGYSGLGLIPSARTLNQGLAAVYHSSALPGAAAAPKGYNSHVGFGVLDGLEFNGRLATQDLHCNFYFGSCPPNTLFRDLSVSLKWSPQFDWLKRQEAAVAVGVTDAGGAAVQFKSTYAVASKKLGPVDLTLGHAKAEGPYAMLRGTFGGVEWKPRDGFRLGLDRIGSDTWTHAQVGLNIPRTSMSATLTWSRSLNASPLTPKQWFNWGLLVPLDGVAGLTTVAARTPQATPKRVVTSISPSSLREALAKQGFHNPGIGRTAAGAVLLRLENTAYAWNGVDAAGVALGVVASAYGEKPQPFVVQITQRGIPFLQLRGDAACARLWLQSEGACPEIQLESLLTQAGEEPVAGTWERPELIHLRPEITLSPLVASGIGTEYGAFDVDVGLNVNVNLPLWRGATVEFNRTEPLGLNSKDFRDPSGYFYPSRIRAQTNRKMFHQTLSLPSLWSQVRISHGTAFVHWKGTQVETQTLSPNGRHRFSIQSAQFENETLIFPSLALLPPRRYELASYRYLYPTKVPMTTEVLTGQFWAGDRGTYLIQRFWHGDTQIAAYMRRTAAQGSSRNESFAGLQISIPLTPRRNAGASRIGLQGTPSFSYALETRVGEPANYINTGGLGQIPRLGEFLPQIFNRDRSSASYLEGQIWRLKNAFQELTAD